MKELFANYESSFLLKEKGFNEKCIGYHICRNSAFGVDELTVSIADIDLLPYDSSSCKAPLFQQAFDWIRKEYKVLIRPCFYGGYELITEYEGREIEEKWVEDKNSAIIQAVFIGENNPFK